MNKRKVSFVEIEQRDEKGYSGDASSSTMTPGVEKTQYIER